MANIKKYEVSTLYKITKQTSQLALEENTDWPGVPFRQFQHPGFVQKSTPVYGPQYFGELVNLDSSIKDYLMPGTIVKFISNVATKDFAGNIMINDDYVLVRLIYARSAVEHVVPITGEVVYPQIQTHFGKFGSAELSYIDDFVGIIKKKYLESFVMDPSLYEELQEASQNKKITKELEKKIFNRPTYTIKEPKGFWWLPTTKEQKFRQKDSFNRDTLVKQYPDEDASVSVVWDSAKTYQVKIMEFATYSDDTGTACGDSPSTQCPLVLIARVDDLLGTDKPWNWANRDDQSTYFPQEENPSEKIVPNAHWGYVDYSRLIAQLGPDPAEFPANPSAPSPATPPVSPTTPPPNYNIESSEDFVKDNKKCKYFVKIKATYKGTDDQLKNDNFFNAAIKQEAFSKLLQNYNKIAAFEPFIWLNKNSGNTSYKDKDKKALNDAFSKIEIQEKKRVSGPSGKVVILLSVSSLLFDKIPDGPSLQPWSSQGASDLKCRIFLKKEGPTFEDIITGTKKPKNYITTRFSLVDVEQLADTYVNVFHRRYVSEYMKYLDLLYIDFQMEADYLMKFVSGIKKLAKDNNLDIIESAGKDSIIDVIFDKNYQIKDIIYNKEGPWRGEYYQFKNGTESFKSSSNNKSTNKLIYDLCHASTLNDPATGPLPSTELNESRILAEDARTRFLTHLQTLHKTWSSPPSSECLAKYTGKDTFDPVPVVFNNNLFFVDHYLNPVPKVKMKTKPRVPRTSDEFTEIQTFRKGPKSPAERAREDKSIDKLIKREGKNLTKTDGSIFSKETNKFVGDIVKSKSVFTMILRSETFFGPKGLYQQLLNKTNLSVWLKSVMECAGYDLKGDDLFEVLCNIVLKNLPMDKIRDEILMNLNEATGEINEWTTKALEDIYQEISNEDFDLDKAMTGLGDVLKYADPKWYPGYDKTSQLYNALNMGKTPVGPPQNGITLGGNTPATKCVDETAADGLGWWSVPDGANTAFGMPEDEVPYLAYPNDKGASKNVYSSGDAVYKWKVFLNYKLSTADPTILQETIKYAFTEEDFVKHGSVFTEKTKLATEKYSYYFRYGALVKDQLGINGIVSLEAYREAAIWWASTPREERNKYTSTIKPGLINAFDRLAPENLKKLVESLPIKYSISPTTVSTMFANYDLVIKTVKTEREISGTSTTTAMTTLCLVSKSSMAQFITPGPQDIVLAELLMAPTLTAEKEIDSKINDFVEKLKTNLESVLNELGVPSYNIDHSIEASSIEPSNFDQLVTDTNQETGEVVKYQSFLSQPKVPTDFQSWKNQLDGYISAGAFSKEGQIRLVTNLVSNYNMQLSALVTAHCNPEFLCKHLEKYILDLMGFLNTGDLSKIGLGKISDPFKDFKIEDWLGALGKLWVAAVLKQIDQSLLETFKWLARYIQLNCELMMSEAGKAVMTEINKLDDGFGKDFAKFGVGLFNLDSEPDPEEAENIIQIAFPVGVTTSSDTPDSFEFEGIDKFRIEDSKYDRIDVNKSKILREARKFIEILKPKDKEVIEVALKEIQSFLYKILLSYNSKKLVVLFSGNGTTALLEEMLTLIEEKYPSLNQILDSPQAINSFFNFVGASVDLELFINSIVSRKIIEDSCELKDLSEDIQVLSSKAILALEEQNRIRNQYVSKIADLAIDNGALSSSPNPISVDHSLVPYPDQIPFLDNAMATARDSIMDSVEMSYRSDVKNIRSVFMNFHVKLENPETGQVFDGFSEMAGSLSANGQNASDIFDSYLNALADYTKNNAASVNFGQDGDNYEVSMAFEEDLYPELQDSLQGKKEFFLERVYKIAAVNGPNSPKEQRLDILPFVDWVPSEFEKFYDVFIDPPAIDGPQQPKPNANFAFVMGINTANQLDFANYESGLATTNYDTYVVLDPFKNHATMASIAADTGDGKYTTAVINNENIMFSWKSGLYSSPAEIFGTEKVTTRTYGDPCSLEDITIPYEIFEEVNFANQSDDAFPEIKDPLLGNLAQNLPLDLKDFGITTNTLPQARMFSKYVMNIFYKNVFEQRRGVYTSPPDNLVETIEKVRSILETYVFPRVTNNIIRSFGEYTSQSKYFDTKEVYKLTETLCDPTKIPFDLVDINQIKEDIIKSYSHHRKKLLIEEQTAENNEFEQPASNGAFEIAMMEGTVRLIIRTYLAELLIRAVFLFDRYVFEEIMDNEMFLELFAKQFLIGIQSYVGAQDPEVFRSMFITECKYLAKTRLDSGAPQKYTSKQILNDETTLIKYLTSLEISDIGSKINSLFNLENEKIKPLKEILFDDLKFGFLRNSGINFGQDTTPRSYFMFEYSDPYNATDLEPIATMAQKSQMVIDQASKQGAPGLDDAVYFDVDGNEIDFEAFPYDKTTEFKLGFGDFVIEPYVRLVDWEVGEQGNVDAEQPNNRFPMTVFDKTFGPNGIIEKDHDLPGYVRKDKYRGVLSLRGLQEFANDLMEHLNSKAAEDADGDGFEQLQAFGKHTLPLTTYYKDLKWGIRLNLIIPADPYPNNDDPFAKLEEVMNKFFSSAAFENRWVPGIHKSYRIYRQVKHEKGGFKKIPYFVIPLTYEEIDAHGGGEGSGIIGAATDLHNQSFKSLADIKPKNYNLQFTRYVKYPSDEDVYKIKFNMGYRDPDYKKFEDGTTPGSVLPLVIHSKKGGIQSKDFDGITSVEDELINSNDAISDVAKYIWGTDNLGLNPETIGNDLAVLAAYAKDTEKWLEQAKEEFPDFDMHAVGEDATQDIWNAHNGLLTTKYSRNQFAQWMGIGVELDEDPYTRTQTSIGAIIRDPSRKDYNPTNHPGLIGRPDYNAKFIIDYNYNTEKGSYPHGAIDNLGCKKFNSGVYQKFFPGGSSAFINYIESLEVMYQEAADDGIGGGYADLDYEDNGKYEGPPLYDIHFKNMSSYKMTRCRKSPSWKQIGAVYPNGEQIATIEEYASPGQAQQVHPVKITLNDVFPPEQYHWSQVATDNQEDFLKQILQLTQDFNYSSEFVDDCIDKHLSGFNPDKPFDSLDEYKAWKENNQENIDKFFECVNDSFNDINTDFKNIYKQIVYKHPGGMPLPILNKTPMEGKDNEGKSNILYLHTGIFTNQVFDDYTKTSLYGTNELQDKYLSNFYDLNKDNTDGDSVYHGGIPAAMWADYLPHSDNIDISYHNPGVDHDDVKVHAGNFWGSYLKWRPGVNTMDSKNNKTIAGTGNAASLEASQIWVKHADSIDFRELANKKTDYLLERTGFMPSYYTGHKEPLSITMNMEKEFPIFDAESHSYKDEDDQKPGVQSKSSLVEVLRSDTDVFIKDMAGNWHDNENIEDLQKTPSDKRRYPRSKLDVWRVKIQRNDMNPWNSNYDIDEEDIYSGNVNVVLNRYLKKPSGEVEKNTLKVPIKINKDMLLTYKGDMFRPSEEEDGKGQIKEQPPLFLEDDNTWGGDNYIGLFPDQKDLYDLKQLIQGLNIGKQTIKNVLGNNYGAGGSQKNKDWVEVDLVSDASFDENNTIGLKGEILDLLLGGSSDEKSRSVVNPLIINESPGLSTIGGGMKWNSQTKAFLENIASVQDVLKLSDLYYISAGLGQQDPVGSMPFVDENAIIPNEKIYENYIGEYDELPPDIKQYYVKTQAPNDSFINGKAAIELKIKMKKTNYFEYGGAAEYENLYLQEPDDTGLITFSIKLYQVRLRSANVLKLGDIEFGTKMEVQELIEENDTSVFVREFFVGDLQEKQDKEAAGDFGEITSIYDYLKDKMLNGSDGKGSSQFQLLFNYIFPIKQYASFVAVYTMFYSLYKKGTAFDTNEKMKHLFTNTKIDLFDLFHLLTVGGDPYKRFGLSNLEERVATTRQTEAFKQNGTKGLTALQEKQKQILDQIRAEGLEPGFFAPFSQKDHSGLAHDNIRMIFEILAEMVDPGFDTFPITPFGWIALLLRRQSRQLAGKDVNAVGVEAELMDPNDPDLCKDE